MRWTLPDVSAKRVHYLFLCVCEMTSGVTNTNFSMIPFSSLTKFSRDYVFTPALGTGPFDPESSLYCFAAYCTAECFSTFFSIRPAHLHSTKCT